MKNKPNFFLITGISQTGGGGGATWEFSPHNPVFFLTAFLMMESQETGMTLTGGDTIAARCTKFSMDQIAIQQVSILISRF